MTGRGGKARVARGAATYWDLLSRNKRTGGRRNGSVCIPPRCKIIKYSLLRKMTHLKRKVVRKVVLGNEKN